jgi:hypothetical protein
MYSIYAFIHQTTLRKAQVVQLQRWKICCPELNYTTLHCTTLQTYDSKCCVAMYLIYGILWIDRYIYNNIYVCVQICTNTCIIMYIYMILYHAALYCFLICFLESSLGSQHQQFVGPQPPSNIPPFQEGSRPCLRYSSFTDLSIIA